MKNRNVQIPYELFFQLLQYFLMENYESEEIIRQGLERKLDTMVNRELYSNDYENKCTSASGRNRYCCVILGGKIATGSYQCPKLLV